MKRAPQRPRGYTAIEVMISMAVLAIGAAAVMTMQRGAVQGNLDARRIDTANSIARLWMERLRSDAMLWTLPNSRNPNPGSDNRVTNAPLLAVVDGEWHAPMGRLGEASDNVALISPGFDLLGRDLPQGDLSDTNTPAFCAQVRLTWLIPNDFIRAEVRVFWPRGSGVPMGLNCGTDAAVQTLDANVHDKYRFVHTASAIRRTSL